MFPVPSVIPIFIVSLLNTNTPRYLSTHHITQQHINFRMGASSATTNGQPTLCLEGGLPDRLPNLSVETCGTGTGFVHQQAGIDVLHMRGKHALFERNIGISQFSTSIGAGFAEIQVSNDELGFQFTEARNGIETSGPEISGSAQWLIPLSSTGQSELILDANAGAAYFEHGPSLTLPQPKLFPFVEISAGFGW
jgi:hypothetical protein